jgi:hypothetical protein
VRYSQLEHGLLFHPRHLPRRLSIMGLLVFIAWPDVLERLAAGLGGPSPERGHAAGIVAGTFTTYLIGLVGGVCSHLWRVGQKDMPRRLAFCGGACWFLWYFGAGLAARLGPHYLVFRIVLSACFLALLVVGFWVETPDPELQVEHQHHPNSRSQPEGEERRVGVVPSSAPAGLGNEVSAPRETH